MMIAGATPAELLGAAIGGALIGMSAVALLVAGGRIAGISGIFASALRPTAQTWQWAFIAGLVLAGLAARLWGLPPSPAIGRTPIWLLGIAGLLVGYGTRLGHGCTSGHGVCGLGNVSGRSAIAVASFMLLAVVTVALTRQLGGLLQ